METRHKVIAVVILVGTPLLLYLTAPRLKHVPTKTAANVSSVQSQTQSQASTSNVAPQNNAASVNSESAAPQPSYSAPHVSTSTLQSTPPAPKLSAPSEAPSAWTNTSGMLTGTYRYVVTYVSTSGQETNASPVSLGVTPKNQRIWLTNIPTSSDTIVEERNAYRTLSNGSIVGPYYLLTSFMDNITTTYYDNTPDSVFSAAQPRYF